MICVTPNAFQKQVEEERGKQRETEKGPIESKVFPEGYKNITPQGNVFQCGLLVFSVTTPRREHIFMTNPDFYLLICSED